MAIIVTPKGWAIEFENPDWTQEKKEYLAAYQAGVYANILKSLTEVVRIANDDTDTRADNDTNYWVFRLIEKMLPTNDDATAFFLERQKKQEHPNT